MICLQQTQPFWQILVIKIIKLVRSHYVIENRQSWILWITRTSILQSLSKSRIVLSVITNPKTELLAMREANSVCTAQCHHFLNRKPSRGKQVDQFRHGHGWSRQVSFYV
ncbi:hypothetical protein CFOL_v3_18297 [Cephalotus follicularis]|uniref:Uncharacterized protein n=1 Tax=Cephalotus follicularis TaxID=3775 RepID=A0A1Q3C3J6_CEPFO|nr:hypothetical protein CFOL_v3_18297 [Cephalotus follicularis]